MARQSIRRPARKSIRKSIRRNSSKRSGGGRKTRSGGGRKTRSIRRQRGGVNYCSSTYDCTPFGQICSGTPFAPGRCIDHYRAN